MILVIITKIVIDECKYIPIQNDNSIPCSGCAAGRGTNSEGAMWDDKPLRESVTLARLSPGFLLTSDKQRIFHNEPVCVTIEFLQLDLDHL